MRRHTKVLLPVAALFASLFVGAGASAADSCPNAAVRSEQGSEFLPDCRAYEKVSPADKNGNPLGALSIGSATESGDAVAFSLLGSSPGAHAGVANTEALKASRGPDGWSTHSLLPDSTIPWNGFPLQLQVWAFSDDLSHSIVTSPSPLTPDTPPVPTWTFGNPTYANTFLSDGSGSYTILTPQNSLPEEAAFQSASPSLDAIAYNARLPETAGDPVLPDTPYAYKWSSAGVTLVSVLPNNALPENGATVGRSVPSGNLGVGAGAISDDGQRVFFHTIDPSIGSANKQIGQLFVRDDHGTATNSDDTTTQITASQRTDCAADPTCGGDDEPDPLPDPAGVAPATFLAAEPAHGGLVLFSSCEKLTDDSTAKSAPLGGSGPPVCTRQSDEASDDLYLYELASGELKDLTTADPGGARFAGLVGTSEDLKTVYFTAGGVLDSATEVAPAACGHVPVPAVPGESEGCNLYRWEDGAVHFIATLAKTYGISDAPSDGINFSPVLYESIRGSRVTADGHFLLFISRANLIGYPSENSAECPEESGTAATAPCSEVYRYDSHSDQLSCLSCPDPGHLPEGDSFPFFQRTNKAEGIDPRDGHLPYNLLSDGTSVFETPNRLVARDVNGRYDVYEYRNGDLHLLSDGTSQFDAHFADANKSGRDVFIYTRARWTVGDKDSQADLYDVRVGGGLSEPQAPTPCTEDACQGRPTVPPLAPEPNSTRFNGLPNQKRPKKHGKHRKKHSKHQGRKLAKQDRATDDRRSSR